MPVPGNGEKECRNCEHGQYDEGRGYHFTYCFRYPVVEDKSYSDSCGEFTDMNPPVPCLHACKICGELVLYRDICCGRVGGIR